MKAFRRLFTYIWPQWPRVIVVFVSAMAIAVLLSVSFMTIIPLLTVMIGSEGLHGWVDRKTCEYHYGLQFYVPKARELAEGPEPSLRTHLEVINVTEKSLAEKAGIRNRDFIADVNGLGEAEPETGISYTRLLQGLTAARSDTVPGRMASRDRATG